MSEPARNEPPYKLSLSLGGYFLGLVVLQELGLILAPIPVAMCMLRNQRKRIPFYIVVAGLAGVMNLVLGQVTLVIPMMLYAAMGIPIAGAIHRRVRYMSLILVTGAVVLFVQLIAMSLQWDALTEQRQGVLSHIQERLSGPEAETISEQLYQQLNMQIWVFEHWKDVFLGIAFSGVLIGVCLSIGWIYRFARRKDFEPEGSFSEFRLHDSIVWLLIVAGVMAFLDYRSHDVWLQRISFNTALGLLTLYSLNGLAIVSHALRLWKPNPWLIVACTLLLFFGYNALFLTFLGLFDTWGDFRERMNERVREAEDSQDHFE